MADKKDKGKEERWRQEARGKGEVRQVLQAKLIRQVGGAANSITCFISTHTVLRSSGLKVQRAQVTLRRVE